MIDGHRRSPGNHPPQKSGSRRRISGSAVLGRVEVAGCIASGKTTFVKALAGHRLNPVYEDHSVNPFWEAFFSDPSAYTFETEITFLLQHYHFAKVARSEPQGVIILDHSFELDMAYAEVGLRGTRKEIFKSIYQEVQRELGYPSVLVFLTCGVEEAARRIRARARPLEMELPLEFLSELQRELGHRIDELSRWIPIVRVNSEITDFRRAGTWHGELVSELERLLASELGRWRPRATD